MAVQMHPRTHTAFEVAAGPGLPTPQRCLVAAGGFALSQAHSRLRSPQPLHHVQRGASPATLEGTAQGFAIRPRITPRTSSRVGLGEACHGTGGMRPRTPAAPAGVKTRLKDIVAGAPRAATAGPAAAAASLDCPEQVEPRQHCAPCRREPLGAPHSRRRAMTTSSTVRETSPWRRCKLACSIHPHATCARGSRPQNRIGWCEPAIAILKSICDALPTRGRGAHRVCRLNLVHFGAPRNDDRGRGAELQRPCHRTVMK